LTEISAETRYLNRVKCLDPDQTEIKGTKADSDAFVFIEINFEHCWQDKLNQNKCASDEEASKFWKTNLILAADLQHFVNLRNQTNPLQLTNNYQ